MTAATPHQGAATMLRFAAAAALLATSLSTAHAQAYPSKPIRLMIGYTAGGSAEAGARPLARALEPDKWSYGTSGVGGPHHLSGEYFKSVTGANLLHVPYKGGGPAMTDLMGGQIPMLFSSLGPAVGAVKSGKIRPLAVTSLKRSAAFPDVPTMDELGLKGFDSTAWYGVLGPAGLPQEVGARWTQALAKVGADKNLLDQINATGCHTEILPPAKTPEKLKADYEKWGRVVKETGIKAE